MWLSFSKNGIRDSNQISTTAPIFLQFTYFRQNLEENVTFTQEDIELFYDDLKEDFEEGLVRNFLEEEEEEI